MKTNIFLTIIAAVALQLSHNTVNAQVVAVGGNGQPTIEQIVDGIAKSHVAYGRGSYNFYGVTNELITFVQATFTVQIVDGRWGFTQMNLNGVDLPIDPTEPMWEIPAYLAGAVQNFSLNLQLFDSNDQQTRYGNVNVANLAPNDDITINIFLNYRQASLAYKLTGDQNSSNTGIQSADGNYSGYYDPISGCFIVSFDPLNPPTEWLVIDLRDNSVVRRIPFNGTSGGSSGNNGYGLALVNEGNVPELFLKNTGNAWMGRLQGVTMDHSVTRGGTNYNGKFITAHVTATTDYVQLYVGGLNNQSIVEAWGVQPDGTMQRIGNPVPVSQWAEINNVTGCADYKFVVYGGTSDPVSGLYFNVYDTTVMWNVSPSVGIGAVPVTQ